jgi:hypothetical protein
VEDAAPSDRTLEQRRLLLEQVEGRIGVQFDELDGLDRKATTVLGATGVLLGLVINNAGHFASSPLPVPLAYYAALLVLAAGLIAGVVTFWPRPIFAVPELRAFLDQHGTRFPEDTLGELISTKAKAFDDNKPVVKTKGTRLRVQLVLLALGGGLLVGAHLLERMV